VIEKELDLTAAPPATQPANPANPAPAPR
jgi:hypothetical protein